MDNTRDAAIEIQKGVRNVQVYRFGPLFFQIIETYSSIGFQFGISFFWFSLTLTLVKYDA